MEASELTLIEIAAEDDSLLHQLPSNDVVSASTSAFAFDFSPLQIPRSNIPSSPSGQKSNADSSILGSGSSYSNKENLNTIDNKSGTRNLSVERQRMKKGRKGYNLRKSLAWDKAFFTEEGVLDSEELSMISGMSHVGSLSVIDEERRDSLTMTTDVASGSANIKTLEENLFNELPSGQPSKSSTSSSLLKRDSLSGSRLSVISRSSQKAPANRGLSKSGSKLGVCSTPVAPPSQKRLLSSGSTKVMPRNSKIPRVPISKHPPLPSTNMHTSSSGSHLKSPAIAQPAQKSTSLTLPSNIKSASKVASISSGGTSKSIKHLAANARKDSTCSSSEFGSSTTNHKARSTGKVSNCLQNNSKQGLQVKMIETVNGTSKSRISSQLPSDNGDGNTKDAQSQGFKASGLRMPSPSMKFFSEGNKKSSNLKSSIPTLKKSEAADHISDFKQIKVQHGSLNHDAVFKKRLSSQVTELCSTASLIDPIEHTEVKHAERSQQVVQEEAPLRDKVPHPTNNADDMKNPLNDIDFQCIKENPTSLTVEEKDMNKFVEINSTDSSLNQNRNADGNTMNSSFASCSKVQLTGASSAIGDVCPILDEETGCSSSATNDGDLLESDIDFSGQHNNYTLAADSNPSTSMLNKEKNPGECMIDNLVQSNSEGNINLQPGDSKLFADDQSSSDMDEGDSDSEEPRSCIPKCGIVGGAACKHVNKEKDDVMCYGDLSATKFGECSIEQDVCNHIPHNENSNTSTTLKISGNKEISDVDSISSEPESTDISNHSRTSFLELSNNDADQLPYLLSSLQGIEEPPLFHGHEIIDSGCQHASLVASNNGTEAATNREVELAQEESDASIVKLAVSKGDDMDLSNCVQLKGNIHNRHHEGSNIEISEDIHQVHSGVQEVEFPVDLISCLSDKGNDSTFQTDGTVSSEEPETNCNMEGICSDYGTEVNTNRDTELSQVVIDDSMVSLATSEREILELNNGVILKYCSLSRDQEGNNIEICDDIHQVHVSVEEVETQTESVSCLSSKGNNSTFQTDSSVSAEEPETNCTMEGICSDYGTEADINRDIELSRVLNDDSMVNLATSKREILEFYNGVRLKDCSLSKEQESSNIEISDDIHQVHISLEEVETQTDSVSCLSSKGNNSTFQTDGSVSAEVPETKCDMEGICSIYGTEATINRSTEFAQVVNDDLIVKMETSKGDDIDWNNGVVLKDSFLKRDQGGSNIEISGDICQVHNCVEEVEFLTDWIICLPSKGSYAAHQIDDSVSADEHESNCNIEGICSDCGTEATINSSTEFTQVMNVDSIVNITSKREDVVLNNGVVLKDSFLKSDEGGSNIEISGDICQMHNSVEEVEFLTDLIICLPSKGSHAAHQIDDSVSAEEHESNCSIEGIFSDCGTESTINRSTEFTQVVNDDSIVNMTTSKRGDVDLNNGVVLKDSFLKSDEGGSNIEISGDICQMHNSVEEVEFLTDLIICLPSKGSHAAHQIDDSVSAEEHESNCSIEGIFSDCGTESTINRSTEFTQVVNDDSIVNMTTSKRGDVDLNNGVVLKDSFLKSDEGGSNIEISGDICQMHNSVEEVDFLTDLIICLPSKGSNVAHQIDDSVSAEEPESKCIAEGICSDCGTEDIINRNIEFSEGMNDVSIVNLAISERDDMDLNNGVPLKDNFLKTDRDGSDIEISGDIHQANSSLEELEFLTDSVSCLSSKGNNAAHQIDVSVSAEEPESKCIAEGICSDCGTEDTINRNIEFSEGMNDVSFVNLATSEREMDLNNGVLLKDNFLKTDRDGSDIEISAVIHQVNSSVKEVEFQTDSVRCLSSKGNNAALQIDGSVSEEEPESKCIADGICSDCGTEDIINRNIEFSEGMNDVSIVNLAISERDDMDLNNGVPLKDNFLKTDRDGSDIEISGDIHQANSSLEELEFLTDSVSCLSSKGNNAAHQIDVSVSAEEPESKCIAEGICSDCGTEDTINRNIEFSEGMNDVSFVNLATSEREMDLNNGVLLKDNFLKTDRDGSDIEISAVIHQVNSSVKEVEFQTDSVRCLSSKGNNAALQIDGSVSEEEPESKCIADGICSDCGTEDIINRNIEFPEGMNDVSIVNLATSERDYMDLNNGVPLKDNFLKTDRDGSDIEISAVIHQVNSSVKEVEFQTDSVSCLSSKGNNAGLQIDGSVSEEEPESKCNMEGICSDCGTEATINRNIEFSERKNDNSIVNLATFERDDMDLNNSVSLKDSFLKTDLDGSDIEISAVIHQVNSSVKEVEFQTDSVSCLSSKGNNATYQINGSVSTEEYENKCNTEGIDSLEEVNANLERTDNQKVTIPAPPHAVPFSDEWLAAIESAGEEILTMKTGAVQHSPTDKSIPEPSPWSPVKRKTAQMIGPFDCTKHTHIQPDQSE